jgi:small GTP-binding protein
MMPNVGGAHAGFGQGMMPPQ